MSNRIKEKDLKANNLIVTTNQYFEGMQYHFNELIKKVDVKDVETMGLVVRFNKWLSPQSVKVETEKLYPHLQLDNIHLLLPPKENCCKKDIQ